MLCNMLNVGVHSVRDCCLRRIFLVQRSSSDLFLYDTSVVHPDSRGEGDTLLLLGFSNSSVQLAAASHASCSVSYLYAVCFLHPLSPVLAWYVALSLHRFVLRHFSVPKEVTLRFLGVTFTSKPCRGFMNARCVPASVCVQGYRGLQRHHTKMQRPKKIQTKMRRNRLFCPRTKKKPPYFESFEGH